MRVYMNIDVNSITVPFINGVAKQKNVTRDMLYPLVDLYRETAVTDILINIFAQSSATESEFFDSYSDIYERKLENGKEVDYSDYMSGTHRLVRELGLDPWGIWIERARENGHRVWISVRMNDAHCFKLDTCFIRSEFYYEAKERGMVLGEDYGYYKGCYDYAYREVRERMLGYIREQLSRYDVDGLELDFSREIQLFKYLTADMDECRRIMTDFIREVKRTVTACERIHGHKILLAIRCMRDFQNNSEYGLDVLEIASEGLCDLYVPSPRFRASEVGIPALEWKRAVGKAEIAVGIEAALGVIDGKFCDMTREVARGVVANYLVSKPDAIYYYNYFVSPHFYTEPYTGVSPHEDETWPSVRNFDLLSLSPEYSAIHKSAVRFVLIPQAEEGYARSAPLWQPIPTPVKKEGVNIEIKTGPIPKEKKLGMILGFEGHNGSVKVFLNGKVCRCLGETSLDFIEGIGYQCKGYTSESTVCQKYDISDVELDPVAQNISVRDDTDTAILTWAEIYCY